ncbi:MULTISPECIES: ComEC/Rec2 family competence protein [Enorma]|uniref:ComEC/Rec2 family competence protein n=1 Tax=Enorma TaxID=1472762 RepID=UPI0003479AE7|nr:MULTISPECIES: ComEC/Rec2 family competence protein [Enorma]
MSRVAALEAPPRPHIPASMAAAAGALLSASAVLECGWMEFSSAYTEGTTAGGLPAGAVALGFGVIGAVIAIVAGCALGRRARPSWRSGSACLEGRRAAVAFLGIGCLIGACSGAYGCMSRAAAAERILSVPASSFTFAVHGDGRAGTYGVRHDAYVFEGKTLVGCVELTSERELPAGTRLRAVGRVEALEADAWGRSSYLEGAVAGVRVVSVLEGAYVPSPVEAAGQALGARRGSRAAAVAVLMGTYVLFTGCAASAVRSFAMVACSLLAGLGGRRPHGLSGLALSAVGLCALDPGIAFDLGFQLSAASVLFIQLFSSYLRFRLQRLGLPRALAEALALTLCAQWATLPIAVPVFGSCSLVAPLANIVLGPVMTALLVAGLAATLAAVVLPPLVALLALPAALAQLAIFLAALCACVPYASVAMDSDARAAVALYALAAFVYIAWLGIRRAHIACALAVCGVLAAAHVLRWGVFAPPAITVLDVGQADAILIRDGSSAVLVDAGVDDEVGRALARNSVMRLDAVVITHWDADHCGGLDTVLDTVPVGALIVAEGADDSMPEDIAALDLPELHAVSAGDGFRVGRFACTVLWPDAPVDGLDNEDSVALVVEYTGAGERLRALLTGDTEVDEERAYAAGAGDIDVLKLGHHGSAESVDAEVLGMLEPEFAVASAGEGNRYGHPSDACVSALDAADVAFLCTKDVGDVTIAPACGGISVAVGRAP